jgi:hypothetical protein
VKEISEFIVALKFSGGGVLETARRFHIASPASRRPARRPTRGSGMADLDADVDPEVAQPSVAKMAAAIASDEQRTAAVRTDGRRVMCAELILIPLGERGGWTARLADT